MDDDDDFMQDSDVDYDLVSLHIICSFEYIMFWSPFNISEFNTKCSILVVSKFYFKLFHHCDYWLQRN